MARPLRLEFADALYHVTSRGDGKEDIYFCDEDRRLFLNVLGRTCERYNWICHAYCTANPKPLTEYDKESENRDAAMFHAYYSGGYTQREIAYYYGAHYTTVSRAIKGKFSMWFW